MSEGTATGLAGGTAVLTPVFGWLVDGRGKRTTLIVTGGAIGGTFGRAARRAGTGGLIGDRTRGTGTRGSA